MWDATNDGIYCGNTSPSTPLTSIQMPFPSITDGALELTTQAIVLSSGTPEKPEVGFASSFIFNKGNGIAPSTVSVSCFGEDGDPGCSIYLDVPESAVDGASGILNLGTPIESIDLHANNKIKITLSYISSGEFVASLVLNSELIETMSFPSLLEPKFSIRKCALA